MNYMISSVRRHHAPSGNRDHDYFRAECTSCDWTARAMHSNRTIEGRALAQRDADDHNRARHPQHVHSGSPVCACGESAF